MNERHFRLMSLAILGLTALACAQENSVQAPPTVPTAAISAPVDPADLEVQAVREIEQINAGKFNPYLHLPN